MRFCPFCAAENVDEATHCASCARRMPAVPARKGVSGPMKVPAPPAGPPAKQSPAGPAAQSPSRQGAFAPPHSAEPSGPPPPLKVSPPGSILVQPAVDRSAPTVLPAPVPLIPEPTASGTIPPIPPQIASEKSAPATMISAPPTPVARAEELPSAHVPPMPEVPEAGFFTYARYALQFLRARWARRGAIKALGVQIKEQVATLDTVLGALGRDARAVRRAGDAGAPQRSGLDSRVFAEENRLLDEAEKRRGEAERSCSDLTAKKADENTRFDAIHRELSEKLARREQEAEATGHTLQRLEEDRRAIRDRRKDIERQQRAYLKAAEDRESQAHKAQMGDTRAQLLRAAHDLRSDAARVQPEREDLERRLGEIEGPLQEAASRDQAARAELEAARRALQDAREGHRHRLAELEAELSHKSRELQQADGEIVRRLVTLGTLINLHRVDRAEFKPHYDRIDALRGAIATREREIDRLNAERFAFDRASLIRGSAVLAGGAVLLITLICIVIVVAS